MSSLRAFVLLLVALLLPLRGALAATMPCAAAFGAPRATAAVPAAANVAAAGTRAADGVSGTAAAAGTAVTDAAAGPAEAAAPTAGDAVTMPVSHTTAPRSDRASAEPAVIPDCHRQLNASRVAKGAVPPAGHCHAKCHLCAASASATPLLLAMPVIAEPLVAGALAFAPLTSPAASFHVDAPERPPRTV